jgi:glycosyltransferase involved in cell wall biosynthesis
VLLTFNPTLVLHIIRFRPDVLLIQGGMVLNNFVTILYAKMTGTPVVWWSLGQILGRKFSGVSAIYQRMNEWNQNRATCYAGYSSVAVDYFRRLGYPPERCFNLINVVDTDSVGRRAADCSERAESLRQELMIAGKKVALFVGALTETKGILNLIRAFGGLSDLPQLHLLIVGEGPERLGAERMVDELGLCDRISFVGAVFDGVEAYFQLADLLVLPGTGGLAISEGMTHGLPVICSVGDGVEVDLIDEGENGYRVEPDNILQLEERMRSALCDEAKLGAMGRHSRRIIAERANIGLYMNEMYAAIFFAYEQDRKGKL